MHFCSVAFMKVTSALLTYKRDDVRKFPCSILANSLMPFSSCCFGLAHLIGNYFGLKDEHEKAVMYFQRALRLNRKYDHRCVAPQHDGNMVLMIVTH